MHHAEFGLRRKVGNIARFLMYINKMALHNLPVLRVHSLKPCFKGYRGVQFEPRQLKRLWAEIGQVTIDIPLKEAYPARTARSAQPLLADLQSFLGFFALGDVVAYGKDFHQVSLIIIDDLVRPGYPHAVPIFARILVNA
ncbi:Uncharacterised protein [uncultured archaeon]|nr:Uncharacterised protein [uncultured archaeon]